MFLLDSTAEHLNNTRNCPVISYYCNSCGVKKLTPDVQNIKIEIFRIISPEVRQQIAFRYHCVCVSSKVHLKLANFFETFPWDSVANMSLLKNRLFLLTRKCLNSAFVRQLKRIAFYDQRLCIPLHFLRIASLYKIRNMVNMFL